MTDAFGQWGYDEITGTTVEGSWFAIKAVNNATATVNVTNRKGDSSSSLTIANGDVIYVTASSITVSSGKVHAYIDGSSFK